jgi:hypothetical protein
MEDVGKYLVPSPGIRFFVFTFALSTSTEVVLKIGSGTARFPLTILPLSF